MVSSKAKTADQYLEELPEDRRETIGAVRKVILANLPKGYEESILWGMITYCIPREDYPKTYNGRPLGYAALASQKNYNSLYLFAVYGDPKTAKWFKSRFAASGKKLDMGKSCVHFRKSDDLPLDLIADTIARVPKEAYIKRYEAARTLTKKKGEWLREKTPEFAAKVMRFRSDQFASGRRGASMPLPLHRSSH